MGDLEIRDEAGHKEQPETVGIDLMESDFKMECEELLEKRLEEAVNVLGMAGVLGILERVAGKKPQQMKTRAMITGGSVNVRGWDAIRGFIVLCARDVSQYEERMEQ